MTSGVEGGADLCDESSRHCRCFGPPRSFQVLDQGAADDDRIGSALIQHLEGAGRAEAATMAGRFVAEIRTALDA